MQHIVVIAENDWSAEKLYSITKNLFPECEIHLVIKCHKNRGMKSPRMACNKCENVSLHQLTENTPSKSTCRKIKYEIKDGRLTPYPHLGRTVECN